MKTLSFIKNTILLLAALFLMVTLMLVSEPSFALFKGEEATREQWPQAVLMFIGKVSKTSYGEKCSGLVLDSRHILTAAHCFRSNSNPESMHISAGLRYRENVYGVDKVTLHPKYDPNYATNPDSKSSSLNVDLAVIKLKRSLPPEFQGIAGILNRQTLSQALNAKQTFWTVAFGNYNHNEARKENHYMRQTEVDVRFNLQSRPHLIGYSMGKGKFCHGDSGSGLFTVDRQGKVFLVGVQSAAGIKRNCDVNPSVGLFAIPGDAVEWIEKLRL